MHGNGWSWLLLGSNLFFFITPINHLDGDERRGACATARGDFDRPPVRGYLVLPRKDAEIIASSVFAGLCCSLLLTSTKVMEERMTRREPIGSIRIEAMIRVELGC
jgi:hypothetical protein